MIYALLILFVVILFQDVRYRGVHWLLFPLVLIISVWINIEVISIGRMLFNSLFLIFLLGSLTLYLSLKQGKLINITKGFFSWGDILFLFAIVPLFDTYFFILFFTVGTILSLIFHLAASMISIQKTIPYAGYMALCGILFVLLEGRIQQLIYQI